MMKNNEQNHAEELSFSEFLTKHMSAKRIGIHHLEKSTGIQKGYLEALVNGNFSALPALPYIRGYVRQIAPLVGADPEELWESYKKQVTLRRSGSRDTLPDNRFALSSKSSRWATGFFIFIVLLLIYLIANGSQLFGKPRIVLNNFEAESRTVTMPSIVLSGSIDPDDTLVVNGELVSINKEGEFERAYLLEPGLNTFNFHVKRFLGREEKVIRHVVYEVLDEPSEESQTDQVDPTLF